MHKKSMLFIIILIIFFNGCYSTGLHIFHKNKIFEKGFQYTQKADVIQNNEVKIILTATYLNPIDSKYQDGYEHIIIGVFFSDKYNIPSIKKNYDLKIINSTHLKVSKIKKDNPLLKELPLKNDWSTYYNLSFKYTNNNNSLKLKDKIIIYLINKKTNKKLIKIYFDRVL